MIGRLRGILVEKYPPQLLIEVAGVAYELQASMSTFYRLPEVGSETVLHTHFVVREDAQQLYGFFEARERSLFRSLIKVNGVGPKMALTILSSIEPDNFVRCVMDNDTASLVRLPGVGKKTAERLVIEMRDRLAEAEMGPPATQIVITGAAHNNRSASQDAVSALIALGYKPQEASRAVSQVAGDDLSSEVLIRSALKNMVPA